MSQKLKARKKAYYVASNNKQPVESQLALLKAKMVVAQQEYDATPSGLAELTKDVTSQPENTEAKKRLVAATLTRQQQTVALEEIKNGRVGLISAIYATTIPDYDEDQIISLMETVREDEEKTSMVTAVQNLEPLTVLETQEEQYQEFLNHLNHVAPGHEDSILKLKELPAPSAENFAVYRNLPVYVLKSQQQLNTQLNEIANLQNTSSAVAVAHYNAYRKQYMKDYSHLPPSQQPNPPANWVKGEFNNSGFAQSPTSRYAPHDKASMYAIHRLRSDENAIPDYMKQSKQYVELVRNEQNDIVVGTYTPLGKKIKEITFPADSQTNLVKYELEGKILFQTKATSPYALLSQINSNDYVSKHFDFPSYRTDALKDFLVAENANPADIFFNARKRVKKIWNSKPARADAPVVTVDMFSI